MKKIEDILEKSKSIYDYVKPFDKSTTEFSELDKKIVNKLFLTFQSIFPAFRQAWPTEVDFNNAKKEWIKAIAQADLRDLEIIKRGVDKFRLLPSPFVPSPGQFIEMCKKEISLVPPMYIALPSVRASDEVQKKEFSKIKDLLGIR